MRKGWLRRMGSEPEDVDRKTGLQAKGNVVQCHKCLFIIYLGNVRLVASFEVK
jgi:hypothetical protein